MRFAHLSVGRDDRCLVLARGDRFVLAVADGAGGSGRGAQAAETVMRCLRETTEAFDPVELLRQCDRALAETGGETTAVIAVVDPQGIRGASVGDSGAWLVETAIDLTSGQERKPLIGSGRALPRRFASGPLDGTLLLASDGLFKYAGGEQIRGIAAGRDLERIPEQLVAAVRLPSGQLQDDVAVIIFR